MLTRSFAYFLTCAALIGCAKKQLTTDTTTAAQRGAETVGADEVPQAAFALQLSKEHLQKAERLYEDGNKEEAESLMTRAEVDAELAIALAQEETEKSEATAAMARVRKVQADHGLTPTERPAPATLQTPLPEPQTNQPPTDPQKEETP